MRNMNVVSLRSNADQQAVSAEIRAAKIAVINITLWIFAWTSFMVVSMLGTWGSPSRHLSLSCPSSVPRHRPYITIIYALSHPKYRECVKELFPCMCIVIDKKKKIGSGADGQSISSGATQATNTV